MAHTYSNLLVHTIFGTKDRRPLLDQALKSELFPYMVGIVKRLGGEPIIINGPRDHVHGLFLMPASLAVSDLMEKLKANSSMWVHQRWPQRRVFGWQEGYAAFSVSYANLARARKYIENQEQHHLRRNFQEELVAFLNQNQISYDPRWIGS